MHATRTAPLPTEPPPPPAPPDGMVADKPAPVRPRNRNTWAVTTLAALGLIAFLYFGRPMLLPIFLATFVTMTLRPVMRWLEVIRIPAPVGAAVVVACVLTLVTLSFFRLSHPAMQWMKDAPAHVEQLRQRARSLLALAPRFNEAAAAVDKLVSPTTEKTPATNAKAPTVVEVKPPAASSGWITWTGSFLELTVATIILTFLLLASGSRPLEKLVTMTPTLRGKIQAVEISHEIQRVISDYLFSVTLINFSLGLLVGAGLALLGVPNAAMWGVCAAGLNFIPYFGPYAGILLVSLVGLLNFPNFATGILPGLWYLLLHLLESNIVMPVLLGRRCLLNPVMIFISLIFWTWLWGIPGAWLAVPILVAIKVACERTPRLSVVAELIGK